MVGAKARNRNLRFPPIEAALLITKYLALNFVERPRYPPFSIFVVAVGISGWNQGDRKTLHRRHDILRHSFSLELHSTVAFAAISNDGFLGYWSW